MSFLPQSNHGPIASYYNELKWDNGFEQWDLVRFSTPMDNNCLFHAIANSFFHPYHSEILDGKKISRSAIISSLRKELANKLADIDPSTGKSYYETLADGNIAIFSNSVPEFKLEYMQSQLKSRVPIGYGYMEFIGNSLDKDIYILDGARHDIYITDELPFTIKGNRNSIVLYYTTGHYELVGIRNSDGTFSTHFSSQHTLIKFLYNRVCQIINN